MAYITKTLLKNTLIFFACSLIITSCSQKEKADLLIYNASIYTVDSSFSVTDAMVIDNGKILATGKQADLESLYEAKEKMDAQGKFIYPGFIDAHAHFTGYGLSLQTVNLVETKSWDEAIERVKVYADENKEGWITGRGWDQNDWDIKEFPTNQELNELFPDRPVLLKRIDGHAAIANQKALDLAGIKPGDTVAGGEIMEMEGTLTGLLVDNAVDRVTAQVPAVSGETFKKAMMMAQQNCFAVGLTTIDDCGLDAATVEQIEKLQLDGDLKMRLYVMLSDS